jgi:hypothetical protein
MFLVPESHSSSWKCKLSMKLRSCEVLLKSFSFEGFTSSFICSSSVNKTFLSKAEKEKFKSYNFCFIKTLRHLLKVFRSTHFVCWEKASPHYFFRLVTFRTFFDKILCSESNPFFLCWSSRQRPRWSEWVGLAISVNRWSPSQTRTLFFSSRAF